MPLCLCVCVSACVLPRILCLRVRLHKFVNVVFVACVCECLRVWVGLLILSFLCRFARCSYISRHVLLRVCVCACVRVGVYVCGRLRPRRT